MDNQEAIKTLRELRRETNDSWYEAVYDMAISALQAQDLQPTCNQLATDTISRQAAIDAIDKFNVCGYVEEPWEKLRDALQMLPSAQPDPCDDPRADVYYLAEKIGIHQLYALVVALRGEPEPCEDAVSRRRLLNDLKELIAAWKKYPVMAEQIKGVETAIGYVELIPPVTPKQAPCEDAISRKSILDKISKKDNWEKYDRYNIGLSDARRIVQDEPSVTPKRKTGTWTLLEESECR